MWLLIVNSFQLTCYQLLVKVLISTKSTHSFESFFDFASNNSPIRSRVTIRISSDDNLFYRHCSCLRRHHRRQHSILRLTLSLNWPNQWDCIFIQTRLFFIIGSKNTKSRWTSWNFLDHKRNVLGIKMKGFTEKIMEHDSHYLRFKYILIAVRKILTFNVCQTEF